MAAYDTTRWRTRQKILSKHYRSNSQSRRAVRPSCPFSSLRDGVFPTNTEVPKNGTSPPSQSANLNSPLPVHSSPPSSDPSSPSAPKLSTPTPPACEVRRFSSSRSRIVRTRVTARCSAVAFAEAFRASHLWATMAKAGGICDGGSEVRAWRT